jgi:hypothetical protein
VLRKPKIFTCCDTGGSRPGNQQRPKTTSLKAVAILPLWLKQHTSLKNLKVHVASIDS